MLPELVKFHEAYHDRMTIRMYDVWAHPEIANGFPLEAIPTQFVFNADGTPYQPDPDTESNMFEIITDATGTPVLTRHVGVLTYEDMVALYQNITDARR